MFSLSRFQQLLQIVPRGAFDRIVREHQGDRSVKRFSCWNQFVVMLFAQLTNSKSLRHVEESFNENPRHHYHLGCGEVKKSTLGDANNGRDPQIFADLLRLLIDMAGRAIRPQEREELLYLIDSTSIALPAQCKELRGHASARGNHGVKLHILYEAMGQGVRSASITAANVNDITEGKALAIEPGATYVFDKGYCDYNWWHSIDRQGARWVTRFKRDAALKFERDQPLPPNAPQILRDSIVVFAKRVQRGGHVNSYSTPLRRIEVARPDEAPLILATNDLESPAEQIAALYKQRWGIELFFKWVKQHLQVRHFYGRTGNAIRIQLLIALITYMLLLLHKAREGSTTSLWMRLAGMKDNLMQRPEIEVSYWRRQALLREHIARVQPSVFT